MYDKAFLSKYKATIWYIITVVVVNLLYSVTPYVMIFGRPVSPADAIVGAIYVVRDFAQREVQRKVIYAMMVGAVLSFLLANRNVALASVAAFVVGETIDYLIFTYTKRPLSQRLLWSSLLSSPVDTYVFLYLMGNVNPVEYVAITCAKFFGVLVLWFVWRQRNINTTQLSHALDS